jgi:hypothetical protein
MTGPRAGQTYLLISGLWRCPGDTQVPPSLVRSTGRVARVRTSATFTIPSGGGGGGGGSGRPTGARYVTYESLYSPGMTLQAVINLVPAGKVLTLPEGLFQFSDFAQSSGRYGLVAPINGGIVGSGPGTILEMVEHSSTKQGNTNDPPQANSDGISTQQTNQLYLLRIEGTNVEYGNFHLRGTNQTTAPIGSESLYPNGHNYNGIFCANTTNAWGHDILITGIPGDCGGPPGETFGHNYYNSTGGLFERITVDGVRQGGDQNGYSVGATGFGNNSASTGVFNNCICKNGWSGSFAMWQCHDMQTNNCTSSNNGARSAAGYTGAHSAHAFNHERCYNITHINPTCLIPNADVLHYPNVSNQSGVPNTVGQANGNSGYHMSWESDVTAYGGQAGAFLKVVNPTFNSDPRLAGRFIVMSLTPYRGVANVYQKVLPYTVHVYGPDGVTPLSTFAYAN